MRVVVDAQRCRSISSKIVTSSNKRDSRVYRRLTVFDRIACTCTGLTWRGDMAGIPGVCMVRGGRWWFRCLGEWV